MPNSCGSVQAFVIGGVTPLGHLESLETFIDEVLLHQAGTWAAPGNRNSFFRLSGIDLVEMTGDRIIAIR